MVNPQKRPKKIKKSHFLILTKCNNGYLEIFKKGAKFVVLLSIITKLIMKIFKITILIMVLAMLGSTFTVDAKKRKRRATVKKEKQIQQKEKDVKVQLCGLDMVEYNYQGMMMSPFANMRVERKNGKVVMVIKGTTTDEKEYVLNDGEQLLREALEIIEEEKMLDYGVSYSLDPSIQVLDGYSWEFSAKLADGRSVSSRGRNAEPGGNGLNRIGVLLYERATKLLGMD